MNTLSGILGQGGGDFPVWSASLTVVQFQIVRSPLDGELYTRTAATGTSATDPADDITNYRAESYQRVTAIVCDAVPRASGGLFATGSKKTLLPAIATGVRTLALEMLGRGSLDFFALSRGVPGTMRVEILLDGRTVFNDLQTYADGYYSIVVGGVAPNSSNQLETPIEGSGLGFRRHLRIYVTPPSAAIVAGTGVLAYKSRSQA
ncbi:hypothetical protein EDF72_1186 [Delftia acidovorans]|uniref:hypothetical protein n=1 Tax=Delftia acidovorans TaxID=80866 RepID=UPI000F4B5A19|nr:hypothetical protein [Delftia acidovorans]ROR02069.1 hypothetical protein EDF72_1186 [Delftia acidovorans]